MKGKLKVVGKMTNEFGAVVWSATYYPFGEMTAGSGNTHGFTGKEFDSEMGLNYFCQRYYDPEIGRFMTRDLIQQPAYSTYAYCMNNPLKYMDPLGLDEDEQAPTLHVYYDLKTGITWSWYWSKYRGRYIIVVAPIADEQIGSGDSPGAGEVESEDFPSFSQMIAISSLTRGSEGDPGSGSDLSGGDPVLDTEGWNTRSESGPHTLPTIYAPPADATAYTLFSYNPGQYVGVFLTRSTGPGLFATKNLITGLKYPGSSSSIWGISLDVYCTVYGPLGLNPPSAELGCGLGRYTGLGVAWNESSWAVALHIGFSWPPGGFYTSSVWEKDQ